MNKEYGLFLTKGIQENFNKDEEFAIQVLESYAKFLKRDWGETSKDDWKYNDEAVINGNSIVAKYKTKMGNIFIITERNHTITTILFASEY